MEQETKSYISGIVAYGALVVLAIFISLAMSNKAHGFDCNNFPTISEDQEPWNQIYWKDYDILWVIYDINGDGVPDTAHGYKPKSYTIVPTMTGMGVEMVYVCDIEDVPITYYWLDGDGDGIPRVGDNYTVGEIMYDPKGDGLNGNEEIPAQFSNSVST